MAGEVERNPMDWGMPVTGGLSNVYQVVGTGNDNPDGSRRIGIRYIGLGVVEWPELYDVLDPGKTIQVGDTFKALPDGCKYVVPRGI